MCGEQIPDPRERVGGRFVPGEKERHQLVAQLFVAHLAAVAFGVLRTDEHREQVAVIAPLASALRDDAIDDGIEARACALEAARRGKRQLFQILRVGQHEHLKERHDLCERRAHVLRICLNICVEQGLRDDGEREAHHLVRDVELLPVVPRISRARGVGDHRLAI